MVKSDPVPSLRFPLEERVRRGSSSPILVPMGVMFPDGTMTGAWFPAHGLPSNVGGLWDRGRGDRRSSLLALERPAHRFVHRFLSACLVHEVQVNAGVTWSLKSATGEFEGHFLQRT